MNVSLMTRLAASVGIAAVSAFGASAIVGRHDVEHSQYFAEADLYPALFGLYKTPDGFNDCMGTIIAPQWALTAAHCTTEIGVSGEILNAGFEVDTASGPATIDMVVRYKGIRFGQDRDIALLRFAEPLANVQPVELYRQADEVSKKVVILGWGDTGDGMTGVAKSDGIFRKAENRVDSITGVWLVWGFDDPRHAPARALPLEGVAGPGDSGGPAFIETATGLKLAGISSGQDPMDQKGGTYGVQEYYVRISPLTNWVDNIMELKHPDRDPDAAAPAP
ncbi:MAG: trypsin-like serine protease [Pseudomonadota bacterium]